MPPTTNHTTPRLPTLLYGGDYNPEQWLPTPEGDHIFSEDLRLMKLAHATALSIGIFSWAALEPEEGRFQFAWLDRTIDSLHKNGQHVILATPSGGKPNWLAEKYPEVRRVDTHGRRDPQAGRHNHCWSSPIYREKVRTINTQLAQRYGQHPALALWHISNEYGGPCYCDLCLAGFQKWLQAKYQTLPALNTAWWARFWSHEFTSWDQIKTIDSSVHGLALDWKRYLTDLTTDFMRAEIAPLRLHSPTVPVTTNMMGLYDGLNYWKLAPHVDLVSWDAYSEWHETTDDAQTALETAFVHDLYRSLKRQPWLLMESTPSATNWRKISRAKRPGLHRLSGLQALAHGSDGVLVFQWRKSRGSSEKFHGAIVDHVGHEHTRTFQECAALGAELKSLQPLNGAPVPQSQVAIVFDWENRWAIDAAQGPRNADKNYIPTCYAHYAPFWHRAIPTDVIESTADWSPYKLVVAPMLYMLRPGVAQAAEKFVNNGGTLVTTYLTGLTDENDLCLLGGFPGGTGPTGAPLRKVLGIWAEETDILHPHNPQAIQMLPNNPLHLTGTFPAQHYAEILHLESATSLATYTQDFYAHTPALTRNAYGQGQAFYIASRNDPVFTDAFLAALIHQLHLAPVLQADWPATVSIIARGPYIFALNFSPTPALITLREPLIDATTTAPIPHQIQLDPYGAQIWRRPT